jgi:DNA-directed RNA polymerase subunit RPC12/RpoP
MTREEALNRVKGYLTDIIPIEGYSEVDEIIKALEQEPKIGYKIENLCDSCTNKACIFQSGILRRKCDFYIAPMPHLEPDNCGNYVIQQEPCEDAISRKTVLNTLFYKSDNNCEVVLNKELQNRIKALPPVNLQKIGHWVRDTITDLYHCSICRSICHQDPKSKDDYCRYCGAKMIEPQESEDKE